MKRVAAFVLTATLALAPAPAVAGCSGWETVTSGGIAIESVERDADGYITEDAVKQAALTMAEVNDEAFCTSMETKLDKSSSPAQWTVDFDADGTSYHYVVNAEDGELITFESGSFGINL